MWASGKFAATLLYLVQCEVEPIGSQASRQAVIAFVSRRLQLQKPFSKACEISAFRKVRQQMYRLATHLRRNLNATDQINPQRLGDGPRTIVTCKRIVVCYRQYLHN